MQAALPAWRWSPFLRNHDQRRTATELGADPARLRAAATLLLTLPGLPFVYYGEELGMTGDKPDERIRTPMPWTIAAPHAGFTRGTPWQPLQSDSLTANVGAQDRDPGSLLNLHRRLIHLRDAHPALAAGTLVPLATGDPAVTAYVRREGRRAVLVVGNLGAEARTGVALASDARALPSGRFRPRDLLGGAQPASLTVPADGRLRGYVPLATLAPRTVYVLDLR